MLNNNFTKEHFSDTARDYFNTETYLDYLLEHCASANVNTEGRVLGTENAFQFIEQMGHSPGDSVLEIGCGIGRILSMIQERFGVTAYGVDVSVPAIEHLKKSIPELSSRAFLSFNNCFPDIPSASMDAVITWGVFELTEQRQTLLEISRVLKPGGTALLSGVKNCLFPADDAESIAASKAYVEKDIPIAYTSVPLLESLLEYLDFSVEKRFVGEYKNDLATGRFSIDQGGEAIFAEAIYLIRKRSITPCDSSINIFPQEVRENVR